MSSISTTILGVSSVYNTVFFQTSTLVDVRKMAFNEQDISHERPPTHVPRWWRANGSCNEDNRSGIFYKEQLFDLNNWRKEVGESRELETLILKYVDEWCLVKNE